MSILQDIQMLFELNLNRTINSSNASESLKAKAKTLTKDFLSMQRNLGPKDTSKKMHPSMQPILKRKFKSELNQRSKNRSDHKEFINSILK